MTTAVHAKVDPHPRAKRTTATIAPTLPWPHRLLWRQVIRPCVDPTIHRIPHWHSSNPHTSLTLRPVVMSDLFSDSLRSSCVSPTVRPDVVPTPIPLPHEQPRWPHSWPRSCRRILPAGHQFSLPESVNSAVDGCSTADTFHEGQPDAFEQAPAIVPTTRRLPAECDHHQRPAGLGDAAVLDLWGSIEGAGQPSCITGKSPVAASGTAYPHSHGGKFLSAYCIRECSRAVSANVRHLRPNVGALANRRNLGQLAEGALRTRLPPRPVCLCGRPHSTRQGRSFDRDRRKHRGQISMMAQPA